MLGVPGALKWMQQGHRLIIETPPLEPEGAPCRYAYVFKISTARWLPATPLDRPTSAR